MQKPSYRESVARFGELFTQLLETARKRDDLRRERHYSTEVVDLDSRLVALRADLAPHRCAMTTQVSHQPCVRHRVDQERELDGEEGTQAE